MCPKTLAKIRGHHGSSLGSSVLTGRAGYMRHLNRWPLCLAQAVSILLQGHFTAVLFDLFRAIMVAKLTIDAIILFGDKNTKSVVLVNRYNQYMEGLTDAATGEARRGFMDVVQEKPAIPPSKQRQRTDNQPSAYEATHAASLCYAFHAEFDVAGA